VSGDAETVVLWGPPGPEELALVEASGWREWPPRLPQQLPGAPGWRRRAILQYWIAAGICPR
jgi:hypothetical protein